MVNTRRAASKSQPEEEVKQPKQRGKSQANSKPASAKDSKTPDPKPAPKSTQAKKVEQVVKDKQPPKGKNAKTSKKDDSSDEEVQLPKKRGKTAPADAPKPDKKLKTADSKVKQDEPPKRATRGAKKQQDKPDTKDKPEESKSSLKRKSSPPAAPAKKRLKTADNSATAANPPSPATPITPNSVASTASASSKDDQPAKLVKQIKKGSAAVDSKFPYASTCHVYEQNGTVYTCTMNQTDIKNNNNKFYIIQILETDASPAEYYIWNRWGRVGYDGQFSNSPTKDVSYAIQQFNKKKNDKLRGGYTELEIMYEEESKEEVKTEAKPKETKEAPSSKLDRRLQDLMNLIFDLKNINRTLAEIGYDAKKMPLGKLSQNNIRQGLEVLKEIEAVLEGKKSGDLAALSGRFYTLIPHDFGFQHMSKFTINTNAKLKEKVEMLDAISEMKIATNILAQNEQEGNPLDDHYKKLNTNLTPLDKDDPTYKILSDYVKNTHASTHNSYGLTVLDIFRAEKPAAPFKDDIDNHMLLWHGSRLTNWVGILSQGLRIAPPEAPVTGYMFGKGVYFADMVSKSANYCFTSRDNNIGLLLCCEVALGECNEKLQSDYNANLLPAGKMSTKGCGKTAPPPDSYVDLEGCKVPLGKGQPTGVNGSLLYNEYIVYDVAQIRMKYLFKIRFDYK